MLSVGRKYIKIAMPYICVIYAILSSLIILHYISWKYRKKHQWCEKLKSIFCVANKDVRGVCRVMQIQTSHRHFIPYILSVFYTHTHVRARTHARTHADYVPVHVLTRHNHILLCCATHFARS